MTQPQKDPAASAKGAGSDILNSHPQSTETTCEKQGLLAANPQDRTLGGQPFWHLTTRPHQTLDGRVVLLEVWAAPCAKCGDLFLLKVPAGSSRFEPNRRCAEHHAPGRKVKRFRPWLPVAWARGR